MDTPASAQTAMFAAQNRALPSVPKGAMSTSRIAAVSKEYESVFISQFLGSMFEGLPTDGITGGGQGEAMFRSLMIDQYAKSLSARGGFGLAASMQAELMKHQQVAQ